jgi:hypothetical protein
MIIPEIEIVNKPSSKFFLYTAADLNYFEIHGKPLISSVLTNTVYSIHIHIINPTDAQLMWCSKRDRLSVSYEYIDCKIFKTIAQEWFHKSEFNNQREKQMYDKGQLYGVDTMADIIEKTYYACCRFIRLPELKPENTKCLILDVDGIVRSDFRIDLDDCDLYVYQKKSGEHLAGAILLNPSSDRFLKEFQKSLSKEIKKNNIYWFLDQIILDQIIGKYKKGLLPMSYIDWEMNPDSSIWSAKGKRKELTSFTSEQIKYNL